MTIKTIYALLILLMSLACCSCDKVSRQPTASDPLQVCSPAADLHTTESEEETDRRVYELTKSDFNSSTTTRLASILFKGKLPPLHTRVVTDILVERLGCPAEEIPYTYYKDCRSSYLLFILTLSYISAEEKQAARRILENRGETIPES